MIQKLADCFELAVQDCQCDRLAADELKLSGPSKTPLILSVGKSAHSMAAGALTIYPAAEVHLFTAPSYLPMDKNRIGQLHEGNHPVPGSESFKSGREILDLVSGAERPILLLLSGGGSSLVESPLTPWITEEDVMELNDTLLKTSLGIDDINSIRKHISAIKGGRLALAALRPIDTLIFSDVPKDREDVVASGPTLGDPSTVERVREIVSGFPSSPIFDRMRKLFSGPDFPESPKPGHPALAGLTVKTLADNSTFLGAFSGYLQANSFKPENVIDNGDMRVDSAVEKISYAFEQANRGQVLLAGGEFTFDLPSSPGSGGRALHFAAAWSLYARERFPDREWILMAAATDGHDGTAPSGGVIAMSESLRKSQSELMAAIEGADTYSFWSSRGNLLPLQPTGINYRDVFALLPL